jgi:hypothetical protein
MTRRVCATLQAIPHPSEITAKTPPGMVSLARGVFHQTLLALFIDTHLPTGAIRGARRLKSTVACVKLSKLVFAIKPATK